MLQAVERQPSELTSPSDDRASMQSPANSQKETLVRIPNNESKRIIF